LNTFTQDDAKATLSKLLVIDDHPVITRGLRWLFAAESRTTTVEVAHSLDEAIQTLSANNLDEYLVLLDLTLPGVSGLEGFDFLRRQWPNLKIAIYSGHDDRNIVLEALRNHAVGFIPKSTNPDLVVDAVHLMLDGGIYMPSELLIESSFQNRAEPDTDRSFDIQRIVGAMPLRRLEVLKLLSNGANNKDICRQLDMSVNTVKTHVSLIFASFEVHSRQEIVSLMQAYR
jgi:DNA-binding NarL/FixJ family response regulator